MPRERGEKVVATNRRARHEYTIEKTYEAGLVLTGTEVKSLRQGRANISDGYAYINGGEAFLDAVHIPEYSQGHWTNHASKRIRKLLLDSRRLRLFGKEFQSRRAQWLRMLAEGEPLAPDFLAAIGVDQRHVRDLVRLPIVSAGEEASVADLVDLMLEHSIKRVLILREGKLVGVVSRADVLRTVLEHVESLLEPI